MSNEAHDNLSPQPSCLSPLLDEVKAQCERLQQMINDLAEEKKRDTQALAAMQAELKEYQRCIYNWAHQQVREEDWQSFREEDYTIAAEDVIVELERQEGP